MKTDSQVQQDVIAELNWEPAVDATKVGVEVRDGVVTLAGNVSSYAEKVAAERAVQRVKGVRALTVELKVAIPGLYERTDADIARSAQQALAWTTGVPQDAIKVTVETGWITLAGAVEWDYQRRMAAAAVQYLMGVKGVSDNIEIEARVSSVAVKADIEAALNRRWHADANGISVAVHGTDVTLSGTVHTWWDREVARQSAWSAPGVSRVVDNITIGY
jgi:osmotically-inducible protein OsmY